MFKGKSHVKELTIVRPTSWASRTLLALLWLYQAAVAPFLGPRCRFVPSCSAYAREAIDRYGFLSGVLRALSRLLRCHPLHRGGFDPLT